jgi:hypothetical protein
VTAPTGCRGAHDRWCRSRTRQNHRIVVREGDTLAAPRERNLRNPFGDAASISVSISRDLLMSQFWQNLQARLQPAVPNDNTLDPG